MSNMLPTTIMRRITRGLPHLRIGKAMCVGHHGHNFRSSRMMYASVTNTICHATSLTLHNYLEWIHDTCIYVLRNAPASMDGDALRDETLDKLPRYPSFRPNISVREVLHGCSSRDPDPLAIHSHLAPGEKNTDVLFRLAGRLDFKREVE